MKKKFPDFYYEEKLWKKEYEVVGIDEVGRGALAGPLYVAAVCFDNNLKELILKLKIDDSKKLSSLKREKLAKIIKKTAITAIAFSSVSFINRFGITKATQKAVRQAVKKIQKKIRNKKIFLLIDAFSVKNIKGIGLKNQQALIYGDTKSISIAAASIIAKVQRDAYMKKLSRKYSLYFWQKNKGYGTKIHIEALKKYGKTKHHRHLFIRNIL